MKYQENKYQPDPLMKDFWRNSERFQDVCNGLLFHGEKVIDDVHEMDSEQATTIQQTAIQRRRDLIKLAHIHDEQVIIGIENQQTKDSHIVYRDMEYTTYKYSILNKDPIHKRCPIITLILYYGSKKWKPKKELKQMMNVSSLINDYFNNWKSLIFDVKDIDTSVFTHKEVKDFFEGVQSLYGWDKDLSSLKDIELTYECALAIGVVTGTQALIDKAEKEKGGMINMCQAVSEAIAESKQQGILLGRNEGRREGKISEKLQCVIKMMNKLKMTSQEATNVLDIPQGEQHVINDLLKDV